mmetsp:Transcript_9944/g.14965  ORF Transcript_9944/g.14965 Transcript_9944/m.14965 type:complete len:306 (+) Transcript_9944:121-1038(+)
MSCEAEELQDYDVGAHVGALFIILVFSSVGAIIPVITHYFENMQPHPNVMVFANFFGAGVIISTAFIHMVLPAIENLTNECLGDIVEAYEPLALLIVMASIFFMHLLEFAISRFGGGDGGGDDDHHSTEYEIQKDSDSESKKQSRGFLSLLLFELGIALHSIIIGVSLGVVSGDEFKTLLIALTFHQFFEGFALGSAIILSEPSKKKTLATVLAFTLSTPIGIAIGISIRNSFNENSKSTLLLMGTLEAISAGVLIYMGLVELLTFGLTLNPKFSSKSSSKASIVSAFFGLYCGAAAMSVIGKWA